MDNRNVLVIAYYFPPLGLSGVQRTLKFVKYLPKFGWNPIVLTCSPTSYYAFDEKLENELRNENIQVFRTMDNLNKLKNEVKTVKFRPYFVQKLGRAALQTIYLPDRQIKWKNAALAQAEFIIEHFNINTIFATAPPFTDFLIANELSKEYNIPYIVDYRDIWIDNPFYFFATPFHKRHCIKLEEDVLTYASKIVVITRFAKEMLLQRYKFLSHDDIVIIPHGYDREDFADYAGVGSNHQKLTITHSGAFQDNRTPKYLFKALSNFIQSNKDAAAKIELRLVGLMRPNHLKMIKKYKLQDNVVCTGYLSHTDAVKQLMESDVLWLMLNDKVRSPGKLYEYFGARKTLLITAPEGMMRKVAMDSKAAFCTDPKDVKEIETTLEKLYKLWKTNSLPTPSESFIDQFNRLKLTEELARELALASEE